MPVGIILAIFGALGGLVQEIVGDKSIDLPRVEEKKLYLGSLAAIILGAVIGYLIDQNPLTAFGAGYIGKDIIDSLIGFGKKTER